MKNTHSQTQFVIKPNCPMTWQANWVFFLSLFCLSCIIASGFAWYGMWLIAPFSGLEMLCLIIALHLCWRRNHRKEIIEITDDKITVTTGINRPEKSCVLQRTWAKAVFSRPQLYNQPNKLWIRAHGLQVEIGSFLNDDEKILLANKLNRLLGQPC